MKPAALTLLLVGLAAAGCGSGAKSPSVASLGTTGTTTAAQSGGSGPLVGGSPRGAHLVVQGNLKFSQCMRAHGVSNFPDPNSSGLIGITGSSGIDAKSPIFQSAQKACDKDLPNGGQPSQQQLAKAKQSALAYAACMRAHGIKDFPDPDFSNGGVSIVIGRSGTDLDPNNPTYRKAQSACRGHLLKF